MVETGRKVAVKDERAGNGQVAASEAASPWYSFDALRREVDRLFEDFGNGSWLRPTGAASSIEPLFRRQFGWRLPAVDVVEADKAIEITAELPGMDGKGLDVTLNNGRLVIRGEKRAEKDEADKGYHLHERQFGSFERSFAVPDDVDADKIEAVFDKGILKVTLPRTTRLAATEKKITVKAA